jgi:hypothetical protein
VDGAQELAQVLCSWWRRPASPDVGRPRGMASHATAIPSRVYLTQQDTSFIRYPALSIPIFGDRLNRFAATNPRMTHGPYAGELIFDPIPLNAAPPGFPTTPNGCVDICAIIQPWVTTEQGTQASLLAAKISCWASSALTADGRSYEKDTADGHGRAYPMAPNAGPHPNGANMVQPPLAVPMSQVPPALELTPCHPHPVL